MASIAKVSDILDILDKYNLKIKLSNIDDSYLNSMSRSEDVNRSLSARFVLQQLLEKSNLKNLSVDQIFYNDFGKPFLPGISFTMSHSGDFVAVAVSTEDNIGIDLQQHLNLDFEEYESFFTKDQIYYFQELSELEKKKWFYDTWCKKEAIMKADGRGMEIDPLKILLEKDKGYILNSKTIWYNLPCPEIEGYSFALYSNNANSQWQWFELTAENLNEINIK